MLLWQHSERAAPGRSRPAETATPLLGGRSPHPQRRTAPPSGVQPFSAAWLAVRERFDAQARSRLLAHRFAGMLPDRPGLVELGAGTGNLFRWLAPIVGRTQHWLWLDHDARLLQHGLRVTAAWARRLGYAERHDADWTELGLETPRGRWSIRTQACDLDAPPSLLPLDGAGGVVCSALLDLFSADWLDELLHAIGRRPFYAAMNASGATWCNRQRPGDALIAQGFYRAQVGNGTRRDPLGPDAPSAAERLCRMHRLRCVPVRSDWTIGPRERTMLHHMVNFFATGARTALPQHRRRIDAWQRLRLGDADAGRLAMRIAHRDILVFLQGGPRHAPRRRR